MLVLACSASATFLGLPYPLAYSAPVHYAYAPQISLSKGLASPLAYSSPWAYSSPLAYSALPAAAPLSVQYAPASYVAPQARVVVAAAPA